MVRGAVWGHGLSGSPHAVTDQDAKSPAGGARGGSARSHRADDAGSATGANAHHRSIAQPRGEGQGPIGLAERQAADLVSEDTPLGPLGPPVDRGAGFRRGAATATGAVVVLAGAGLVVVAHRELVLIVLAAFLALGGEPVVSWLVRHRWPRAAAVAAVVLVALAAVGGFLSVVVPVVVEQAGQLPGLLRGLQDPHTLLGRINTRFGVQGAVQQYLGGSSSGLFSAGQAVFGALGSGLVVAVLAVYVLADLPRIRRAVYRFVPAGRRARAVLLGDAMMLRVGGYVLGNILVSLIAGVAALAVLLPLGVPYAWLLATVVAVLDLIPVAGSLAAGVLVSVVAFTVSAPVGWGVVAFFVAYRFVEDYLVVPFVVGRVVKVPALLTLFAVLLGAALYGIVGVLLGIPVAAAVHLLIQEIVFPRLDRTPAPPG